MSKMIEHVSIKSDCNNNAALVSQKIVKQIARAVRGHFASCGAFASVFRVTGSKDVVIKVGYDDPAYVAYAKKVASMQDNPFAPKVSKVMVLDVETGNKKSGQCQPFIIVMENLRQCSFSYFDHARFCHHVDVMISKQSTDCGYRRARRALARDMSPDDRKHLFQLIKAIRQLMKNRRDDWATDLHNDNVMYRGKQRVVTDPISSCCYTDWSVY